MVWLVHQLWQSERRAQVRRQRLEAFRGPVSANQPKGMTWTQWLGDLVAPVVGVVEQRRLMKLLSAAGIRERGSLTSFIASKAITALVLLGIVWLTLELRHIQVHPMLRVVGLGFAFLMGWRLPDLVLNRLIKARRLRLEQGMPDALDLLVICAEAGLSLNQAIDEISHQLRASNKDVADEFTLTASEMRLLPDLGRALDNMVERTQLTQLRSMVATLKQSLQFGTPLTESLRIIAVELRAERHARMEERAARLPVLIAIPMMAFILPCLLMIIGTPVVLRMIDVFKSLSFGAP
jgi:tight adherence protein C